MHDVELKNKNGQTIGHVQSATPTGYVNGVWVDLDSPDKSTTASFSICVEDSGDVCISMTRNLNKKDMDKCDFALVLSGDEVYLQGMVKDEKVQIRLSDLLAFLKQWM